MKTFFGTYIEHNSCVQSNFQTMPKFQFDTTTPEDIKVPEGWSRVYKNTYLEGNSLGHKIGVGRFPTLAEATKVSDQLGDKSGGVTLHTDRGFYVRKCEIPKPLKPTWKSYNKEYSWIKIRKLVEDSDSNSDSESDSEEFSTPPTSPGF